MAIPEMSQHGISPLSFQKDGTGQINTQHWLSTMSKGLMRCWGRGRGGRLPEQRV